MVTAACATFCVVSLLAFFVTAVSVVGVACDVVFVVAGIVFGVVFVVAAGVVFDVVFDVVVAGIVFGVLNKDVISFCFFASGGEVSLISSDVFYRKKLFWNI